MIIYITIKCRTIHCRQRPNTWHNTLKQTSIVGYNTIWDPIMDRTTFILSGGNSNCRFSIWIKIPSVSLFVSVNPQKVGHIYKGTIYICMFEVIVDGKLWSPSVPYCVTIEHWWFQCDEPSHCIFIQFRGAYALFTVTNALTAASVLYVPRSQSLGFDFHFTGTRGR